MGLPNRGGPDAQQLATKNLFAARSAALAKAAYERQIIGGEENPHSSFLWSLPSRQAQQLFPNAMDCVVDLCACGRPFRARTRCRIWHCRPQPKLSTMRCNGRGVCDFSKKPHVRLTGVGTRGFNTAAKAEYPPVLCAALAKPLVTAYATKRGARLWIRMQ